MRYNHAFTQTRFLHRIQQQSDVLKSGMLANFDVTSPIEQLENIGADEIRELPSRQTTNEEQRLEFIDLPQDNPNLKHQLGQKFIKA